MKRVMSVLGTNRTSGDVRSWIANGVTQTWRGHAILVEIDPTETLATPNHNALDAVSALSRNSFYQLRCRL